MVGGCGWCLSFGALGLLPGSGPVVFLFLLVAVVGHGPLMPVAAVGVCLLVGVFLLVVVAAFVVWRSGASARPGQLVFVVWCSGASRLSPLRCWRLCFGGVCLLPLGSCGLWLVFVFGHFGASARSGVFLFPLVVVVGVVSWCAGALACFAVFLSLPFLVAVVGTSFGAPSPAENQVDLCWGIQLADCDGIHILCICIYIYILYVYIYIYIHIHPIPPNPGNFSGL